MTSVSLEDLQDRLGSILLQIDSKLKKIGPLITELGDLRKEAAVIQTELKRRGAAQENGSQSTEVQKT